jgi:hypothetical protein
MNNNLRLQDIQRPTHLHQLADADAGCGSTAKSLVGMIRSRPKLPNQSNCVWPVWLHSAVGPDHPTLKSNVKTKILARSLLSFINSTKSTGSCSFHAHSIEEKQPPQTSTAVLADLSLFSCSIDIILHNRNSFLRPQRHLEVL